MTWHMMHNGRSKVVSQLSISHKIQTDKATATQKNDEHKIDRVQTSVKAVYGRKKDLWNETS